MNGFSSSSECTMGSDKFLKKPSVFLHFRYNLNFHETLELENHSNIAGKIH